MEAEEKGDQDGWREDARWLLVRWLDVSTARSDGTFRADGLRPGKRLTFSPLVIRVRRFCGSSTTSSSEDGTLEARGSARAQRGAQHGPPRPTPPPDTTGVIK